MTDEGTICEIYDESVVVRAWPVPWQPVYLTFRRADCIGFPSWGEELVHAPVIVDYDANQLRPN